MMKKLLLVLLLCVGLASVQAQEKLTNQSVVEMIELEFGSDVIVSKIENSASAFDTSIEALKTLKTKGVPSAVLAAMVKASKPAATKAKMGIYALVDSVEVQLLPTVFSGTKTNTLASMLSYGIASAKVKSVIGGVSSPNVLPEGAVQFIFYFDPNKGDAFGQNDWWFRTATSPNEFALARFAVNDKKNYRELEVGSINAWVGSSTGVTEKLICPVEIEQRSEGVFVVTTIEPLEPGEYCFYYKGIIPQGGYNNQSAFDFSITALPVVPKIIPAIGYVTRGEAVDSLPLAEGLLYLGQFGGWNGSKYTKGLYLEPRGGEQDPMAAWGGSPCVEKGMRVPTNEQLQRIVRRKEVAANLRYAFMASYYWSLTADSAEKGWSVQVPSGDWYRLDKGVRAYVRCVQEY